MNETSALAKLDDARDARKMRDLINLLDEAAKVEQIEPDGYFGRYDAAVMLTFEQMVGVLCMERAHRETF